MISKRIRRFAFLVPAYTLLPHTAVALHAQTSKFQKVSYCTAKGHCSSDSILRAINQSGIAVGDYRVLVPGNADRDEDWIDRQDKLSYYSQGNLGFVAAGSKLSRVLPPVSYRPGVPPPLLAYNIQLVAINSRGRVLVVQQYQGVHYFLYDVGRATLTPVGLNAQISGAGAPTHVRLQGLTGLNNKDEVVGFYRTPHGPCAVRGTPALGAPGSSVSPADAGTYSLLGCPAGAAGKPIAIKAVNDREEIAGTLGRESFLWDAGHLTIVAYPGAVLTQISAINDSGIAVGTYQPAASRGTEQVADKGFVYESGRFRTIEISGASTSFAFGINDRGQVVGGFRQKSDGCIYGFSLSAADLPLDTGQ